MADLAIEQNAAGDIVPFVVPNIVPMSSIAAAGWGDAAVIVPWVLYQRYSDTGILATQFESMRAWVDCIADIAGAGYLWNKGFQFGDWLDPNAPPEHPQQARTAPFSAIKITKIGSTVFPGSVKGKRSGVGTTWKDCDTAWAPS